MYQCVNDKFGKNTNVINPNDTIIQQMPSQVAVKEILPLDGRDQLEILNELKLMKKVCPPKRVVRLAEKKSVSRKDVGRKSELAISNVNMQFSPEEGGGNNIEGDFISPSDTKIVAGEADDDPSTRNIGVLPSVTGQLTGQTTGKSQNTASKNRRLEKTTRQHARIEPPYPTRFLSQDKNLNTVFPINNNKTITSAQQVTPEYQVRQLAKVTLSIHLLIHSLLSPELVVLVSIVEDKFIHSLILTPEF